MDLRALLADDDAVSPVIGVILMVAITVILAAVIGTFVLGLGDQVSNTAPTASFTFDFTEDSSASGDLVGTSESTVGFLDVTHDGGDSVQNSQLSLNDDDGDGPVTSAWTPAEVSAGDTANVSVGSDDTVRVLWEASGGGDTATLGKWTGPDA